MAFGDRYPVYRLAKDQNILFLNIKSIKMDIILTIVYVLCFIVIFRIFFKTVNYFEKI